MYSSAQKPIPTGETLFWQLGVRAFHRWGTSVLLPCLDLLCTHIKALPSKGKSMNSQSTRVEIPEYSNPFFWLRTIRFLHVKNHRSDASVSDVAFFCFFCQELHIFAVKICEISVCIQDSFEAPSSAFSSEKTKVIHIYKDSETGEVPFAGGWATALARGE